MTSPWWWLRPCDAVWRKQRFRFFLLLSLTVWFWACESGPPPDITDPAQLLYLGYAKKEVNCARCHGGDGRGGQDGPDLRRVFEKYDEDEVLDIIESGKGRGKDAMPPFEYKVTESELQLLLRFLRQIQLPAADSSGGTRAAGDAH